MSDARHPVEILADEFAERLRRGEHPSIEEYAQLHPDHAELIRSLFPSVARLEKVAAQQAAGTSASQRSPATPETLASPQQLGDFRVQKEIGRGGMGVVYEALQESLRRHVALKVMASPGNDARRAERFRREAEAAAVLHHTNIVAIFGTGEDQGYLYYAMQLIHGSSLSHLIHHARSGRLAEMPLRFAAANTSTRRSQLPTVAEQTAGRTNATIDASLSSHASAECPAASSGQTARADSLVIQGVTARAAKNSTTSSIVGALPRELPVGYDQAIAALIADAASGLAHAHQHGIVHRDIKPSNLMLDNEGTIWITDFGVAKRAQMEDMTQSGEIVGTLRYMAPEQLRGTVDPRGDIYSLGLVLYELVTLTPAIQSTSEHWIEDITRGAIKPPSLIRPSMPRDLEVIIQKATANDPADRYSNASAFEEDLRRFVEDRPILASPESTWRRMRRLVRRNPAIAGLTAAALVLSTLIAVILAVGNHQRGKAIVRIAEEFNRAEDNLREKTQALAVADAERERAEGNLRMALEAFSQVIDNIGSRGGTEALLEELDDEESALATADTMLNEADIKLLEQLLDFFDRFAISNGADLSADTAAARQRIGDIQRRLGRWEEAANSYKQALELYQKLAMGEPSSVNWTLAQVLVLNELMTVEARQGHAGQVIKLYEAAKSTLQANPGAAATREARFAEAKLCQTLASSGARTPRESWVAARTLARRSDFRRPISEVVLKERLARENEANLQAITILESLLAEDDGNISYRLTQARALREQARITSTQGELETAREYYDRSVQMIETLCEQYPESAAFQFELVETLRRSFVLGPGETPRLARALRLCDELVRANPEATEYRAMRAGISKRLAELSLAANNTQRAVDLLKNALDDQRIVAGRMPDVVFYQLTMARTLLNALDALRSSGQREQALTLIEDTLSSLQQLEEGRPADARLGQRVRAARERLLQVQRELMESNVAEPSTPG